MGKKVKVKALSGDRVRGTLRAVNETGVTLETRSCAFSKATLVELPFATLQAIEKDYMGLGAKIGIVAGLVGSAIFGSLVYTLSQPH